jgi:hypothetical protein
MDAHASSDEDESTQNTTFFLLQAYNMHDKLVASSADLISCGNDKKWFYSPELAYCFPVLQDASFSPELAHWFPVLQGASFSAI